MKLSRLFLGKIVNVERYGRKLITCYYTTSNTSCRKAEAWFENNGIEVSMKRVEHISRADLLHILSLSENGFRDLLRGIGRTGSKFDRLINMIKTMKFNEAVDCILSSNELLRVPIIFDEKKLVVGFNLDEIRAFLPRDYRRLQVM